MGLEPGLKESSWDGERFSEDVALDEKLTVAES